MHAQIITIKELVEANALRFGTAVAFQMRREEAGYRQFTYGQVLELTKKIQAKLQTLGVAKGERVVIISENRPEWPLAFLAVTSMGAVAVPIDAMLRQEEILPLIQDSEPKAIILCQRLLELARGTSVEGKQLLMEDFDRLEEGAARNQASVLLDDLASIVYTSGTMGTPKGVMLTHRNIISNVLGTASLFDLNSRDNFLSVLPLHHTFETTAGFLAPFSQGSRITYAESLKSPSILRNMQETGVTIMCGVPLLYQLFYDGIMREVEEKGKSQLFAALLSLARFFNSFIGLNIGRLLFGVVHKKFGGRIRFFASGGAAIDPGLVKQFQLLGFTVLQGYGLTESAPILSCCTIKANKTGSVGKPIPGVEIKIAGSELTGEIMAFGPNIMKGYYKRKDLTAEVIEMNGWLHTGDIGYIDEAGYLFITGRAKDVIVTPSGVNVYPEELEGRLKEIKAVKESCVLGAKVAEGLRKGTEDVVAVVVPNEGVEEKTVTEAIEQLNRRLADYKRIARIIFRQAELPKTRLLKVKKFALKKELGLN